MAERQPPNTQTLRPQHLTQVGHEGNPVECFVDVVGTLDSPNPFCTVDDNPTLCTDGGGPVTYPIPGSGGSGSGGGSASLPLNISGGTGNCWSGDGTVPIVASGGTPPYTFSTTVGSMTQDGSGNATLNPPANANPTYGGANYVSHGKCSSWCCVFVGCGCQTRNCAGNVVEDCTLTGCGDCCASVGLSCSCSSCGGCSTNCCLQSYPGCSPGICDALPGCCSSTPGSSPCGCVHSRGIMCDRRDAAAIAAGCAPCQITMDDGAVVSVTDADGNSASVSISYSTDDS